MRSTLSRLALVLAIAGAGAACGDDDNGNPNNDHHDAAEPPPPVPDAVPVPPVTFTTFVIDQIQNHTVNNTAPVPFADFATLPDPDRDSNNTRAYDSLFQ